MTTTIIDIARTPTQLSELLSLVSSGVEVIIANEDKAVARLVPIEPPPKRIPNLNPGSIKTTDDFDEELPDEFWIGAK